MRITAESLGVSNHTLIFFFLSFTSCSYVIADCRRLDDAAFQAILAKRVHEQVVPPDPRA
jgi:hypothetical protein